MSTSSRRPPNAPPTMAPVFVGRAAMTTLSGAVGKADIEDVVLFSAVVLGEDSGDACELTAEKLEFGPTTEDPNAVDRVVYEARDTERGGFELGMTLVPEEVDEDGELGYEEISGDVDGSVVFGTRNPSSITSLKFSPLVAVSVYAPTGRSRFEQNVIYGSPSVPECAPSNGTIQPFLSTSQLRNARAEVF